MINGSSTRENMHFESHDGQGMTATLHFVIAFRVKSKVALFSVRFMCADNNIATLVNNNNTTKQVNKQ